MENVVSVVIPVYNVEKYLDRCVESIINQTYRNLEIILVDDGSPDRCPQMCDDWAKKDARIKVIHKENQGQGLARNTGIEHAMGSYICFFDSDDYIAEDLIEKAHQKICLEQADIVLFGCVNAHPEKNVYIRNIPVSDRESYECADVINRFLPEFISANRDFGKIKHIPRAAWGAFYRMDLIQRSGWRFASERKVISEDIYSHLILYKDVKKVVILKDTLYYYCFNGDSFSRNYRPDRYEKIKHFYKKCLEACNQYQYPDEVARSCMEPFISFTIAALKQEAEYSDTSKEGIRRIVDDPVLLEVLRAKKKDRDNWKKKILFFAIRNKLYAIVRWLLIAQNSKQQG